MFDNEARKVLEIKSDFENELELSFLKMIKRYPPEFFPEKSLKIRKAFYTLGNDQKFWRDVIYGKERNSLGKNSPYIKSIKEKIGQKVKVDHPQQGHQSFSQ